MKRILQLGLMVCFLLAPLAGTASQPDAIGWLSFDEAKKMETQNRSKKFLLYFYTDWCGYCRKLEKKTFVDKAVADFINSHFIPVRINSEKLPQVAARYGVGGVPDLRFLSSAGEDIGRCPGYIEADKLLPLLKYVQTDSYLKMAYPDFLKHN